MELTRFSSVPAAAAALAVVVLAVLLAVGPTTAAHAQAPTDDDVPVGDPDPPTEDPDAGAPAEDEDRKLHIGQTPRDQVGLIFLGALLVGGALAFGNARRQLKGDRPQATGEFRWR